MPKPCLIYCGEFNNVHIKRVDCESLVRQVTVIDTVYWLFELRMIPYEEVRWLLVPEIIHHWVLTIKDIFCGPSNVPWTLLCSLAQPTPFSDLFVIVVILLFSEVIYFFAVQNVWLLFSVLSDTSISLQVSLTAYHIITL